MLARPTTTVDNFPEEADPFTAFPLLREQLMQLAESMPICGGALNLLLSDAEVQTLGLQPFVDTPHPGPPDPDANRAARDLRDYLVKENETKATIQRWMNETVREKANHTFLADLRQPTFGLSRRTAKELFAHLSAQFGTPTPAMMQQAGMAMEAAFDGERSMFDHIAQFDKHADVLALVPTETWSDLRKTMAMTESIKKSPVWPSYKDTVQTWEHEFKDIGLRKWPTLRTALLRTAGENPTATAGGFAGATQTTTLASALAENAALKKQVAELTARLEKQKLYCEHHKRYGHTTDNCNELKAQRRETEKHNKKK